MTDADTIAEIEKAIMENSISENEISGEPGIDVSVDGTKYRRITKEDRNYDKDYGDHVFGTDTYRYFQWEPIKWKVLNNDGESLFLITDQAIDCKSYHETEDNITWEKCNLRTWLNGNFYASAFDENEQNAIIEQNLINEDNAYEYTDGGNDTKDKVYLLSLSDACDPVYGYCSSPFTGSASRWQQPTDYTFVRGAYTYSSNNTGGNQNCWWWIRTPGESQKKAVKIGDDGNVGKLGSWCDTPTMSVCPVVKIDLSSQEWSLADDGSSGEGKVLADLKATIIRSEYSQGATINVSDLKVTATYLFCSKSYDVPLLKDTFTTNLAQLDTNTSGEKTIIISYTDRGVTKTANVNITIAGSSYEGTTDPDLGNESNTNPGTGETDNPGTGETDTPENGETNNPETNPETGETDNPESNSGTGETNNSGANSGTEGTNNSETNSGTGGTNQETGKTNNSDTNKQIKVEKLAISAPSKKLAAGKKIKMTVTVSPENASNKEVEWKTSNENYATVNENGEVSIKTKGAGKKVTITAVAKDGSGVKVSYKITIMKHAVKSIKIKASSKTINAGSSMKLKTVVKTTGKKVNKTLKWTSSNTAYATVSKSGKIKAKKAGKGKSVIITAASTDGSNKKAKIKIKIK